MVASEIEQRIRADFSAIHFALENESFRHNVPPDSETHFKITLVSDDFVGVRRVKRHQLVYGRLQDLLDGPVHALALHLHTAEEWKDQGGVVPTSPNCRGGESP